MTVQGEMGSPQFDVASILIGVLTLLADDRKARIALSQPAAYPTELLLSDAGLENTLIALVVGKKPDAVRMAVNRAKKATEKS